MSILGYSASYFLPEYWGSTPLYGEKIIPLIDYILSTDFSQADKLANAFYTIENKYKNTGDLPIDYIKAIIEESGYEYVLKLLGNDEDSIKMLVYLLVLIHQLKGTGLGIEMVLNLLNTESDPMIFGIIGDPEIRNRIVSDFTETDYVYYSGLTVDSEPFELLFPIRTSDFKKEQCIASVPDYSLYLGINTSGSLVLSLGSNKTNWNIANRRESSSSLSPNTNYFIKLTYDGFEYDLKVSTDNVKFTDYIVVSNSTPTGIHKGRLYLGVNGNTIPISNPFEGSINLEPFSVDVQNITITQWFESLPVGDENTFIIKADLDLTVVSTDFFENFANFVSRYVYPTLKAFEAKIKLENALTFIPYSRQKITYIAKDDVQDALEEYSRNHYPIDSEFSLTSKHPLQNKVVSEALKDLNELREGNQ